MSEEFDKKADNLRKGHLAAGLLHLIQSSYAYYFVNNKYSDRGKHLISNDIRYAQTDVSTVSRKIGDEYKLGNVVATFPLLSTINHFISVFGFDYYKNTILKQGYNPIRWAEYSVSAPLMMHAVSQLSGITDVKLLTTNFMIYALLMFTGYQSEVEASQYVLEDKNWRAQIVGFGMFFTVWTNVMTAFFTSLERAKEEPSFEDAPTAMIYSIIFVLFFLMISFGVVSVMYTKKGMTGPTEKDPSTIKEAFLKTEWYYIILSLISKSFLTNMVLFGVIRPPDEEES
jgi:hypothetical protein